MNAVLRGIAVLTDPVNEWARVEQEPGDAAYLLTRYVALLALIPAISAFLGACVIGVVVPGAGTVRAPLFDGIFAMVFGYVATFVQVLVVGLLIDALAPLFGGRRNFTGALTLAVYSLTPVWLVGVFLLLPGLYFLLLAGLYGAYLLITGLPVVMKSSASKSLRYGATVIVFAGLLMLITVAVQRALFGPAAI